MVITREINANRVSFIEIPIIKLNIDGYADIQTD